MAVSKIATITQTEVYTPTPRRPQLIWQGRDRRHVADPVPAQTLETVRPVQLAKVTHGTAEPGLWQGEEGTPLNRLIWTNDTLVALTSLLHGDDQHEPLEGKSDLIYIDPPFAVQSNFSINVEIEDGVADEKQPTLIEQLAYCCLPCRAAWVYWRDGPVDSSLRKPSISRVLRRVGALAPVASHCRSAGG